MAHLARSLFIALAAPVVAAMGAAEQRDWLITGQLVPRAPDLISRDIVPPPLDLATTQVAPGQWLYLPPTPRQIPQAELDQASSENALGADVCSRPEERYAALRETGTQIWIDISGFGRC